MADARMYGATVVAGLAGAGAVVVGAARPWVTGTASQPGLPPVTVSVDGSDIVPLVSALGVVMLAAFGAVIATRGWARRVIGALVVVSAVTTMVLAIRPPGAAGALRDELTAHGWSGGPYSQGTELWRWLVVVGAIVCLGAGVAVIRYGGRWPAMGARYDAPTDAMAPSGRSNESWSEPDLWKAIDQGQDPTLGPEGPSER